VLVEGFKHEGHPKIEIHRAEVGKPLLYPDDPQTVAIASDPVLAGTPIPCVSLNDIDAIADLVERFAMEPARIVWAPPEPNLHRPA
jgi:molybdopterin-guanine dinucleotide biosynthesis protein B